MNTQLLVAAALCVGITIPSYGKTITIAKHKIPMTLKEFQQQYADQIIKKKKFPNDKTTCDTVDTSRVRVVFANKGQWWTHASLTCKTQSGAVFTFAPESGTAINDTKKKPHGPDFDSLDSWEGRGVLIHAKIPIKEDKSFVVGRKAIEKKSGVKSRRVNETNFYFSGSLYYSDRYYSNYGSGNIFVESSYYQNEKRPNDTKLSSKFIGFENTRVSERWKKLQAKADKASAQKKAKKQKSRNSDLDI